MRRMMNRQANLFLIFFPLLFLTSACSPSPTITLTPTVTSIPSTATSTFTPSPVPPTSTPTPLACLTQPGEVKSDVIAATNPAQEFLIYLPPCYSELREKKYPVLYLLHG